MNYIRFPGFDGFVRLPVQGDRWESQAAPVAGSAPHDWASELLSKGRIAWNKATMRKEKLAILNTHETIDAISFASFVVTEGNRQFTHSPPAKRIH
jgi:hypothetical protein